MNVTEHCRPQPDSDVLTVLLAGGFGTRVAHLLPSIPKPMAPVAGRPFIEWVIRYFNGAGLSHFALSTGHLADAIEAHFAPQPVAGVKIICRRETTPLGTGGGFLNTIDGLPPVPGGYLVANGDSVVVTDPSLLVRTARANGWEAAVLGLEVPDASRYGSLQVAPDGTLQAFAEKRPPVWKGR